MGMILVWSVLLVTHLSSILAVKAIYRTGVIQLDLDLDDKNVHLNWQVTNIEDIYGFKVSVTNKDDENIYTSPILHKTANSLTINEALQSGKARVCVAVLVNETEIITDVCDELEVNDLQMVIGILAGVVFLIPCVVAMSYILYKDMKVTKQATHDPSEIEILISPIPGVKPSTSVEIKPVVKHEKGKDNPAFDNEMRDIQHSPAVDTTEVAVHHPYISDLETSAEQNKTQTCVTDSRTAKSIKQNKDTSDSVKQTDGKTEIYVIKM